MRPHRGGPRRHLRPPGVKRGLLASGGGLIRTPDRIPYHVAMERALTGAPISAERAVGLGVVNRLAEPGGALAGAPELARKISANGRRRWRAPRIPSPLRPSFRRRTRGEMQERVNERVARSEEAAEGARAFVEERESAWRSV